MTKTHINVYVTGGSSTQSFTPDKAPLAGWGQTFGPYFDESVTVINHAITDRSSKSFIEEGRLAAIDQVIGEGDYLFVHFGHNDMRKADCHTEPFTTYKTYLNEYVETARRHNAVPVLLTPVRKREFGPEGRLLETRLGEYAQAVLQLGDERSVDVIDLYASSAELFERLGSELTQRLFLWLVPGENSNYPGGKRDNLHFNEFGASQIAGLIAKEIRDRGLPLAARLRGGVVAKS
jgi:lysophospholipase L1-like esterase